MNYTKISPDDYDSFHKCLNAYYREGEDADTPQEEIDAFIRFLFDKIVSGEISGCFADRSSERVGFALWALDTDGFQFSEMPGFGTVMEIGILEPYRSSGLGSMLLTYVESRLKLQGAEAVYVSAYGPAVSFWRKCGYLENGKTASNGLPIMIKSL